MTESNDPEGVTRERYEARLLCSLTTRRRRCQPQKLEGNEAVHTSVLLPIPVSILSMQKDLWMAYLRAQNAEWAIMMYRDVPLSLLEVVSAL